MQFLLRPLSWPDVEQIATWQYEAPYTEYDGQRFAPALRNALRFPWLSTHVAGVNYFAVDNEQGDLVGLFEFWKLNRQNVKIRQLQLRPDLTGQGHGLTFVQAGLAFGKQQYALASFQVTVAPFNERALKVLTRAGLIHRETHDGGRLIMLSE